MPLLGLRGIKSLSVVLDHQRDPGLFVHEGDVDVLGLGVLADVAHGFLGNAKEREFRFVGQGRGSVIGFERDREWFLSAQGGDILAQRLDKAKIVEHGRMNLIGEVSDQGCHDVEFSGEAIHPFLPFGHPLGHKLLTGAEITNDLEQLLSEARMPLRHHSFPFLFLGENQAAQEPLVLRFIGTHLSELQRLGNREHGMARDGGEQLHILVRKALHAMFIGEDDAPDRFLRHQTDNEDIVIDPFVHPRRAWEAGMNQGGGIKQDGALLQGIVQESSGEGGVEFMGRRDRELPSRGHATGVPSVRSQQKKACSATRKLAQEFIRELLQDGVHIRRGERVREGKEAITGIGGTHGEEWLWLTRAGEETAESRAEDKIRDGGKRIARRIRAGWEQEH